jgi:hypothetical protein
MNGRQIDQARNQGKSGKARWHVNCTEQSYKPREIKLNPQLEYMHDELGLNKDIGSSELSPGY